MTNYACQRIQHGIFRFSFRLIRWQVAGWILPNAICTNDRNSGFYLGSQNSALLATSRLLKVPRQLPVLLLLHHHPGGHHPHTALQRRSKHQTLDSSRLSREPVAIVSSRRLNGSFKSTTRLKKHLFSECKYKIFVIILENLWILWL